MSNGFLRPIKTHAEMEMRGLFPAMDENIRCKTLMERYLSMSADSGKTGADALPEKGKTDEDMKNKPDLELSAHKSVARLSGEHKLIARYVSRFERALREKDETFFTDLSTFLEFLDKDLRNHCIVEELSFFPAALNGCHDYDMTMTVLSLQKDHGIFENELQSIRKSRSAVPEKWFKNPAIKKVSVFFKALNAHSVLELTHVFPDIARNHAAKILLVEYLNDMKSKN